MLPDFPIQKKKAHEVLIQFMILRMERREGIIEQAGKWVVHEGDKPVLVREDGTVDPFDMKHLRADCEIRLDEVESMSPEDIIRKVDSTAGLLANQMAKQFYAEVKKACQAVGNVSKLNGEEINPQHVLDMLAMIQVDFDATGKPILPSVIAGPHALEKLKPVFEELEKNPEWARRFDELMDRKREDWSDRESNRKLVG